MRSDGLANVARLLADPRELRERPDAPFLVVLRALEIAAEQRLGERAVLERLGELDGLAHRLRRLRGLRAGEERPAPHERVDERALASGRAREPLVDVDDAYARRVRLGGALEERLAAVRVGVGLEGLLERVASGVDVVRLEA